MPLAALANSLVLPLLGLLVERPAHPYELTSRLNDRYAQLSTQRSSVTTLVKSLAAAGLIRAQRQTRVGKRPRRRVYELTDAGVEDFRQRVAAQLEQAPAASTRFTLALAYVGILPRRQAATVLRERLLLRQRERDAIPPLPGGMPEVHMIEADYWKAVLATECEWLARFIDRITTGTIEWPLEAGKDR
jgi:DNA-binding PadR family transcriptional regulator